MTTPMSFWGELYAAGACEDALAWVVVDYDDPNEAWHECKDPDWMRWLLIQADYNIQATWPGMEPGYRCGCVPCSMGYWTAAEIRQLIPDYPL